MRGGPAERAGAILEIDLAGIAVNWRLLAERVWPAQCAAVVKADAYGLGARRVAPALAAAGCRRFFVASIEEGIALRGVLPEAIEIAVLNGLLPGCGRDFLQFRLTPVLNDPGQIAEWRSAVSQHDQGGAMLHLDTGMARLGLTLQEFDEMASDLGQVGANRWRALITHLGCSDEPEHPLNRIQLERFVGARRRVPDLSASIAASSGLFLGTEYHLDFVRPGAALYGVNPQPGTPNPMRQIVRLNGRILQTREVDRGQTVGYGATHVMAGPGRLATVAVGYADGWLRSVNQRGSGRIGGRRVPLLGRVSMDLIVFDVSDVDPELSRPGLFVELLGDEYGIDAVAADAGTIGYEILTALGKRYHRIYRDSSDPC
jgi:alanine racemase